MIVNQSEMRHTMLHSSIADSSDNILWSWLIWATAAPAETTYSELTIMDRNLGALGVGDVTCRGLMYEWGSITNDHCIESN